MAGATFGVVSYSAGIAVTVFKLEVAVSSVTWDCILFQSLLFGNYETGINSVVMLITGASATTSSVLKTVFLRVIFLREASKLKSFVGSVMKLFIYFFLNSISMSTGYPRITRPRSSTVSSRSES